MIEINKSTIASWDRFYRANFINSLSGFKSVCLIGTKGKDGIPNLAIFNNIVHLGADPAMIGFINRPKAAAPDTIRNIEETGMYTMNHIHPGIIEQAHQTSAKYDASVNEFEAVGLDILWREDCAAPFVKDSPIQYQLTLSDIIPIPANGTFLVTGYIESVYLQEDHREADGFLPLEQYQSVTSLGIDGYYQTKKIMRLPYARP
ncbi:MAG: flavin reductase [Sediminibacterium sp. Gen4]|jgi:flavin reductase (DIM6/NTAB) family NADH-FMN oxidoreductase RutF|uniref:flavin reductase family protein n=1 Tax=unclassified Sediminibacterium TaxID=2635961 RepID=UPI0015BF2C6C|nr:MULTISPECIES: flavin reductase [unclassified Sediminibacterium]MBW0161597.1 flavin reductase [Sediminibacterium sp.]MBW0163303.1 flavin reductase [Sediminibacterium sp.]NWK66200.1 flavin reductase [Sediminibacterium sp. Gen4]